jgi:hypothetical protein
MHVNLCFATYRTNFVAAALLAPSFPATSAAAATQQHKVHSTSPSSHAIAAAAGIPSDRRKTNSTNNSSKTSNSSSISSSSTSSTSVSRTAPKEQQQVTDQLTYGPQQAPVTDFALSHVTKMLLHMCERAVSSVRFCIVCIYRCIYTVVTDACMS